VHSDGLAEMRRKFVETRTRARSQIYPIGPHTRSRFFPPPKANPEAGPTLASLLLPDLEEKQDAGDTDGWTLVPPPEPNGLKAEGHATEPNGPKAEDHTTVPLDPPPPPARAAREAERAAREEAERVQDFARRAANPRVKLSDALREKRSSRKRR
jgi:hypothetical protein